ncbi:MAG: DEAD/DEAH box helicase [Bacteroidales bacterium]|nr:DEAD/DEAH box helicase [Bacteroidales bacterium]NPV36562.1 DEAD/DEAH box helicase [Bacteroidales bacterium]
MNLFELLGLRPELVKAVEELGYREPTPIQESIIPKILNPTHDLTGLAQTGTGKTAAYGLPLLQLTEQTAKKPQVIILSPTRELCVQISNDLKDYAKYLEGIRVTAVYGGASIEEQIKGLRMGSQIVAGTPGRVIDLMERGALKLDGIKYFVLDEADEMLSMGFKEDIEKIFSATPTEKRTFLFSATMPREVQALASRFMKNTETIEMARRNRAAENIQHYYYLVHAKDKYQALKRACDIYPDIYGMVFCQTRAEAKEIADKLIADGYNADALHGDLSQAQRDLVMHRFRSRTIQMLVATDVAARGLDVDDITHVIHYGLPSEAEIYIHRSGRTARAGKSGISLSILHTRELRQLKTIEKIAGIVITQKAVPTGEQICARQLFHVIHKIEHATIDEERISQFLPEIYSKLSWLSKEDLIKRIVAEEFNRFSAYYDKAPDINFKPGKESAELKPREKGQKREKSAPGKVEEGFTRLVIGLGYRDRINPNVLIRLINKNRILRDARIGHIEITDYQTYMEVETDYARPIKDTLENTFFNGELIVVEFSGRESQRKNKKGNKKKGRKGSPLKEIPFFKN